MEKIQPAGKQAAERGGSTRWSRQRNSHDGRRLKVVLAHALRLPQAQDLRVVEATQFVLQLVQGGRLHGQSSGDLLPDHLHHLVSSHAHTNAHTRQRRRGGVWCTLIIFHGRSKWSFTIAAALVFQFYLHFRQQTSGGV